MKEDVSINITSYIIVPILLVHMGIYLRTCYSCTIKFLDQISSRFIFFLQNFEKFLLASQLDIPKGYFAGKSLSCNLFPQSLQTLSNNSNTLNKF